LAVQGLWKATIRQIFANHMKTCFHDAMKRGKGKDQDRVIAEVIRVMELAER
jgi:DNA-binding FrmR family transcriptional regulator